MLGAQILLGFQLQAPFQNAFASLMWHEKATEVAVLCILVLVLGLLIAPSARHRIVGQGEATAGINRFITRISVATLFPFAIALALDLVIAGRTYALAIAVGVLFAFPTSAFSQGVGPGIQIGPGGVHIGDDHDPEGSLQECEELRKACLHKEELGEQDEGNCRRYREICRD